MGRKEIAEKERERAKNPVFTKMTMQIAKEKLIYKVIESDESYVY